ncbi:PTS sugar transporter subunit IIA [bacterium]|nr:PTS sugar transporter subunit IIA [bacterium]
MIGMVIVAHGGLADEFIQTTQTILGKDLENSASVAINALEDPEAIAEKIETAVRATDSGDGVIIFTDMFGGTPSNVALTLLKEGQVEVITGMNLPMILKLAESRNGRPLAEIVRDLVETGRQHLALANDLLRGIGH